MEQYAVWVRDGLILLLVGATSYTDLRYQKIRNIHTFPAMGLGLGLGAVAGGWGGLGASAAGIGVGLLVLGVLFALGVLKAGDVKLAMAFGAFCGPLELFRGVVLSFVLFVPVGLIVLLTRSGLRNMWPALKRMGRFIYTLLHPMLKTEPLEESGMTLVPFGMMIGVGVLLVHFLDWLGPGHIIP